MEIFADPPRWEQSSMGQRLLNAPWDGIAGISLFLVIKEEAHFHHIKSLNPDSSSRRCLWITDKADSDDSRTTIRPDVDNGEFGAIALWAPDFIHEKARRSYPPSFLIGRKSKNNRRFADVWIGESQQFSRAEFIIGLKNGFWVIQCLGSPLVILGDTILERRMPGSALHPHKANQVKWLEMKDGFMIEIYCRSP